jgi:acetyl esterase
MPLDEHARAFIEKANLNPAPAPGSLPLDTFREAAGALRPLGWDREEVAEVHELLIPVSGQLDVPVRVYRPQVDGTTAMLVCAHGGSWVRGSVEIQDEYYRTLANKTGCIVAAVDYHLAPESQYPNPIEEILGAARWLQEKAADFGADPDRVAIYGESSGGNLAAAATLLNRERDHGPRFAHQILLFPILAIRFDSASWNELGQDYVLKQAPTEWGAEQYAPNVDRRDPLLSPLFAESHADLPPALIITAEYDPLRDDGEEYAEALRGAGVPVRQWRASGLIHHAPLIPKAIPSAVPFLDEVCRLVREALAVDQTRA